MSWKRPRWAKLRLATRERSKLQFIYKDRDESESQRVLWPLVIAYLDGHRYIVACCETRQGYHPFRTDWIASLDVLNEGYPGRRAAMISGWEERMAKRRATT